jgi:hypothetical protein
VDVKQSILGVRAGGWMGQRLVLDGMVKRKMAVPVRGIEHRENLMAAKLLTDI